jgi:hypothetical protein
MALILSKSPYHIGREDLEPNASLRVDIGIYQFAVSGTNSFRIFETYNYAFRSKTLIDIAPVIHDTQDTFHTYLTTSDNYFTEDYSNNNLIVEVRLEGFKDVNGVLEATTYTYTFPALRGYSYSTDSFNYDATPDLASNSYYAGSSDIVYKLNDSTLDLPFVNPTSSANPYEDLNYNTYVIVYAFNNNILLSTEYLYFNGGAVYQKYSTNNTDIDKITVASSDLTPIKTIEVRTIEECKHNPYRLSFRNRFGVWESLWFFKKSTEVIKVKADEFRANQLTSRINVRDLNVGYNNTPVTRSIQEYNKNGLTEFTLNSGFVDESLNESFKQLLLSEEVVLYDFNEDSYNAVRVANTDLQFKTSTNDKLINYEIRVKMANDMIDNII